MRNSSSQRPQARWFRLQMTPWLQGLVIGFTMLGLRAAEEHWSLRPLKSDFTMPPAPQAIDHFIDASLAEKGLHRSPAADARTLLRRVMYDLTGLPPSPEELAAFTQEMATNPTAYEHCVDRLLASPRYGERWARHWLDTVHFADTHGFEHDVARDHAWRYRDYVVGSFNADTPWPRFVREQLAADYFYPEEPRLTAALGFLGAGPVDISAEATAPKSFEYLDRDDLVTQTMAAFVSTTANCARCHAHKFDPITQEDYFALQAVFAGVGKGNISYDEDASVARQRLRWQALLAPSIDSTVLLAPENEALVAQWEAAGGGSVKWQPLTFETFASAQGSVLTLQPDGSILASGGRPLTDTYTLTSAATEREITAFKLELLTDPSLPAQGPGRADNGNLHLTEFLVQVFPPQATVAQALKVSRATADFSQDLYIVPSAIDAQPLTSWAIHPQVGQPHEGVFVLETKLHLPPSGKLMVQLQQLQGGSHLIGRFRLSTTDAPPAQALAMLPAAQAALQLPRTQRSAAQQATIAAAVLPPQAREALSKLPPQAIVYAASAAAQQARGATYHFAEPRVINVLTRGELDKPGEVMGPGALSALTHFPGRLASAESTNEAARRAFLADWIAHRDNVLTWRSIVNRVWHYHFGRGLCDTPSDFGKMGGVPSHPALIDWLAVWFRDEAHGSLKALHRLIVTSATYRQASAQRDDAALLDGDNRLLWRQNRLRIDADAIRDFTRAVAGTLDLTMGGPGVQHFKQSPGPQATPALDYPAYDWSQPGAGRRSIYRHVWRGIADPFLEAYDFPDLGLLAPVRGASSSSLQALTLFNNEFTLYHSMALGKRLEREASTLEAQLFRALQLAWLRDPSAEETRQFTAFAQAQGLSALCRLLFNANEFLFLD